jgi:hypothetical protein
MLEGHRGETRMTQSTTGTNVKTRQERLNRFLSVVAIMFRLPDGEHKQRLKSRLRDIQSRLDRRHIKQTSRRKETK